MAREIDRRIQELKVEINDERLARSAYRVFYRETPIRSGNARRQTRRSGNEITAAYPYAGRLDQGYSRQSPEGMTKPTIEFLQEEIKRIGR